MLVVSVGERRQRVGQPAARDRLAEVPVIGAVRDEVEPRPEERRHRVEQQRPQRAGRPARQQRPQRTRNRQGPWSSHDCLYGEDRVGGS